MVFVAGFIFREKIPFFASTGDDPVAYWKFDEGTGMTAYDRMNSNDGTLASGNSTPTWIQDDLCLTGKCLRFDGTDDYVSAASTASTNITSNAFTLSGWIKLSRYPGLFNGYANIVGKGGYDVNAGYELQVRYDGIIAITGNAASLLTGSTVPLNSWQFIVGTYNGSNWNIYINGVLSKTGAKTGNINTSSSYPVYIGRREPANNYDTYLPGYIDEVKIYNYARSADQIKADYAARGLTKGVAARFGDDDINKRLSDGLVGYWKMDESTWVGANAVLDSSGNLESGTAVGGATVGVGKFGNGGNLDGANDYVDLGTGIEKFSQKSTLTAWIKIDTLPGSGERDMIFANTSSGVSPHNLYLAYENNSGTYRLLTSWKNPQNTDWSDYAYNITLTTGQFYHIGLVIDTSTNPDTAKFYIDGIGHGGTFVYGSTTDSDRYTAGTLTAYIGYSYDNTPARRYWDGIIDELRIYNRAFDPSEVKALYEFAPGPVGWWKMDEGVGSTAVDSSGNGNNGSLGTGNSAPAWANGKFGKALKFDGVNDYVAISDPGTSSIFDLTNGQQISISLWIKPTFIDGYQAIISKGSTNGVANANYSLQMPNGCTGSTCTLEFWYCETSDCASNDHYSTNSSVIQNNTWQHVVFTHTFGTPSAAKFYINGNLQPGSWTGAATAAPYQSNDPLWIGTDDFGEPFNGQIDDVKIYNYARTPAQIVSDMNAGHPAVGTPVGSTVLHLKMDEGYGSTVQDWSPQGNDGTLGAGSSAPSWTNDGKFGKALSFDGTNDYVTIPDNDVFTLQIAYTISTWMKLNTIPASTKNAGIVSQWGGGGAGNASWVLTMRDTGKVSFGHYDASSSDTVYSNSTLSTGQWYHVVAVWTGGTTGSNAFIYLNGNLDATDTMGIIPQDSGYNVYLGRDATLGGSSVYLDAMLDEVKIYPFALTADQVKLDYNQGKAQVMGALSTGVGGTTPSYSSDRSYCVPGDTSTCSAPVGEWNFEEGVGGTANDTSGNGNVGRLAGGPTWTNGKVGKALSFDGSDDYVDAGTGSSITNLPDSAAFTAEAWVKFDSLPVGNDVQNNIFGKSDSTDHKWHIGVRGNGSTTNLNSSINNVAISRSSDTISTNTWYHLVMVYDDNASSRVINLYLNGSEVSYSTQNAMTGSYSADSSNELRFGSYSNDTAFTDGLIDNVRIYDYARTPAQIAWEYNRGAPVGYYKFEECTGTSIKDWGSNANGGYNGNTATLTVGAAGTQTSAGTCSSGNSAEAWNNGTTGKKGASLNFDGVDDDVTIPDNDSIDFDYNQDFSISVWFTTPSAGMFGVFDAIVEKWAGGTGGYPYSIRWDSDEKIRASRYDLTHNPTVLSRKSYADDRWHHVSFTKNGSTLSLYIDGILDGTATDTTDTTTTNAGGVEVARQFGNYYAGQIDEVKIFNYPLTKEQVKTEMVGGAVRFQ